MNAKLLLVLLTSIIISGCSSVKEIETKTTEVERAHLDLANPDPVKPRHLEWIIITPENVDEVFAKLEKGKYSLVLYGLTDDGYENLSLNLKDLRKFIIEQGGIIKSYKQYYEKPKEDK